MSVVGLGCNNFGGRLDFERTAAVVATALESALDELVQEGKVRYIGSSQLDGWQVADAEWVARSRRSARFISAQNHYNLLERAVEASLVPACVHYGIGILPFFPLASGLLTGKYRPGGDAPPGSRLAGRLDRIDPTTLAKVEALAAFAAQRGITLLDVAISSLAARPAVASVIPGATRPEHVKGQRGCRPLGADC
ncbi:MAG TPA: aldo/keto reductase [Acidimicrobiales bacterium]|nr:aldo/keto reductase [Acidimicrobiales bacterium]